MRHPGVHRHFLAVTKSLLRGLMFEHVSNIGDCGGRRGLGEVVKTLTQRAGCKETELHDFSTFTLKLSSLNCPFCYLLKESDAMMKDTGSLPLS